MENTAEVLAKAEEIKAYGKIVPGIEEEKILKQAKLTLTVEKWVSEFMTARPVPSSAGIRSRTTTASRPAFQ